LDQLYVPPQGRNNKRQPIAPGIEVDNMDPSSKSKSFNKSGNQSYVGNAFNSSNQGSQYQAAQLKNNAFQMHRESQDKLEDSGDFRGYEDDND
jgi:hypothetical protein